MALVNQTPGRDKSTNKSRLRLLLAVVLGGLLLVLGLSLGFAGVLLVVDFMIGGADFIRELWQGKPHPSDRLVLSLGVLIGIPVGSALAIWVWYLVVTKSGLLTGTQVNSLLGAGHESSQVKPLPQGLGFAANVVWIVLVVVLAAGFSLVGYHLANVPYEGWDGMQRHQRFPTIIFPNKDKGVKSAVDF